MYNIPDSVKDTAWPIILWSSDVFAFFKTSLNLPFVLWRKSWPGSLSQRLCNSVNSQIFEGYHPREEDDFSSEDCLRFSLPLTCEGSSRNIEEGVGEVGLGDMKRIWTSNRAITSEIKSTNNEQCLHLSYLLSVVLVFSLFSFFVKGVEQSSLSPLRIRSWFDAFLDFMADFRGVLRLQKAVQFHFPIENKFYGKTLHCILIILIMQKHENTEKRPHWSEMVSGIEG